MRFREVLAVSPSRWVAVGMALLAFWVAVGYESGQIVLWPQLEAHLAAMSLVVASVATTWSALEWQLVWRKAEQFTPPRSTPVGLHPWFTWVAPAFWISGGVLVGSVVGVVFTQPSLAGTPNLAFPATWVAVAFTFSSIGTMMGRFLPRYLGPVLSGLLVYLGLGFLMYGGSDARNLMPLADGAPSLGFAYSASFLGLQAVFLLATALAIGSAVISLKTRTFKWVTVGTFLTVGLLGFALVSASPVQAVEVVEVCDEGAAVICGPEQAQTAFQDTLSVVEVFEALSGHDINRVDIVLGADFYDPERAQLIMSLGSIQLDAATTTANALVAPQEAECVHGYSNGMISEALAYIAVPDSAPVSLIGRRVAEHLTADESWLASHWLNLRECTMLPEDVPGSR